MLILYVFFFWQLREQEAAELQKKIAEKQRMLKEQNDLSSARTKVTIIAKMEKWRNFNNIL